MSLLIDTAQVLAQGPTFDLGGGMAPPGSNGILKGLKMLFTVVSAIAVAGALGLGGKLTWSALSDGGRGGGGNVEGMGWYLMGCIIIGSASGIPAMLM